MLGLEHRLNEQYIKSIRHTLVDVGENRLAKAMGITTRTLRTRLKNPDGAKLTELRALYRTGKLTDEQFLSFIREK